MSRQKGVALIMAILILVVITMCTIPEQTITNPDFIDYRYNGTSLERLIQIDNMTTSYQIIYNTKYCSYYDCDCGDSVCSCIRCRK